MINWEDIQGLDEPLLVESSGQQLSYLLVSKDGHHIKISPSSRQLLRWVKEGRRFEDLAAALSRQKGREVSAEELRAAYARLINSIENAINSRGDSSVSPGFWFRIRVVPARVVYVVASRLSLLFQPAIFTILVASVIALILYVLELDSLPDLQPAVFWQAYGLFLLSLVAHEFGHAAACARYGSMPSDIGFTMYLIYPAFYSDVTNVWQLKRWQRIVVDVGGNYFQYLVAGVYVVAFLFSEHDMFRLAITMVIYCSAFSLNPILKFDGYWLVTDALGVTNLGRQPTRFLRQMIGRIRGRTVQRLPWSRLVTIALIVYSMAAFAFWGYLLWRIIPLVFNLSVRYPGLLLRSIAALVGYQHFNNWAELGDLAISTFILFAAYFMVFRMLRICVVFVRRRLVR